MSIRAKIGRGIHWVDNTKTGQAILSIALVASGVFLGAGIQRSISESDLIAPKDPYVTQFSPALGNTDAVLSLQHPSSNSAAVHHRCTATLIKPDEAVTAAHCVTPPPPEVEQAAHAALPCDPHLPPPPEPTSSAEGVDITTTPLTVRGRSKDYRVGGETATVVAKYAVPGWNWSANKPGERHGDLAVLKLDHPMTTITPIPVATEVPPSGTWTLVVGWGTRPDLCGDIIPTIQQWALKTASCPEKLNPTKWEYCTSTDKAAGPCNGTSGGPLLTLVNGVTPAIIGVYSKTWGTYCGQNPQMFTSLPEYKDFISQARAR